VIENELFTVGLVKDSAIIAPDSARDTVLARTRPELFRTARWVSEESGHERKAASTTPSRSAGCELDLHGLKDSSCDNKNISPCAPSSLEESLHFLLRNLFVL